VLHQVFSNLLENAMRFVPPGVQPEIRIWSEPKGACARIWVQDNGIGIEPQHHHAIFNVFHRLHGIADYPGTGIGLAIVKRGIERLGGQVGLQSAPGQGSRFWIELQVAKGTPFTHDFDHSSHTRG
jgi:signal transduction histidine kinase